MSEIVQLQDEKLQPPEQTSMPEWLRYLAAGNVAMTSRLPRPDNALEVVMDRIQELEYWTRPASPKAMGMALTRLSLHYPVPTMSREEREMWLSDYRDDMGHLPEDLVIEACERWRKNPENKWFPRPCELLALVRAKYDTRKSRLETLTEWYSERA